MMLLSQPFDVVSHPEGASRHMQTTRICFGMPGDSPMNCIVWFQHDHVFRLEGLCSVIKPSKEGPGVPAVVCRWTVHKHAALLHTQLTEVQAPVAHNVDRRLR